MWLKTLHIMDNKGNIFSESLNTLNHLLNEQNVITVPPPQAQPETPEQEVVTPKMETDYIQILDNNQMLLTCRECAKIFTTLEGLRCHKRVHSGTNKLFKEDC